MTRRNIAYPPEIKGITFLEKAFYQANRMNSNFIVFVVGMPGSGKSKFAQLSQFLLDRGNDYSYRCLLENWCMTQKQFIDRVDFHGNDVGRVIVWEEPYAGGVKNGGANARNFMKWANLQISTIFQTMRHNNHIILLTLPDSLGFDKQARGVAHCTVHVRKNNGEYGTARVYMRDYNPIFKTEKFPFLKKSVGGRLRRVKNTYFGLPPKSFGDACDQKSDDYKEFWRKEINDFKQDMSANTKRDNNRLRFHEVIMDSPALYRKIVQGKEVWDYGKISKDFGVSYSTATHYAKEVDF